MINQNLRFMSCKEIHPHVFYFLDENEYLSKCEDITNGKLTQQNISTVGNLDLDKFSNLWYISYQNFKLPVNLSRIEINPLNNNNSNKTVYIIYGELRVLYIY